MPPRKKSTKKKPGRPTSPRRRVRSKSREKKTANKVSGTKTRKPGAKSPVTTRHSVRHSASQSSDPYERWNNLFGTSANRSRPRASSRKPRSASTSRSGSPSGEFCRSTSTSRPSSGSRSPSYSSPYTDRYRHAKRAITARERETTLQRRKIQKQLEYKKGSTTGATTATARARKSAVQASAKKSPAAAALKRPSKQHTPSPAAAAMVSNADPYVVVDDGVEEFVDDAQKTDDSDPESTEDEHGANVAEQVLARDLMVQARLAEDAVLAARLSAVDDDDDLNVAAVVSERVRPAQTAAVVRYDCRYCGATNASHVPDAQVCNECRTLSWNRCANCQSVVVRVKRSMSILKRYWVQELKSSELQNSYEYDISTGPFPHSDPSVDWTAWRICASAASSTIWFRVVPYCRPCLLRLPFLTGHMHVCSVARHTLHADSFSPDDAPLWWPCLYNGSNRDELLFRLEKRLLCVVDSLALVQLICEFAVSSFFTK